MELHSFQIINRLSDKKIIQKYLLSGLFFCIWITVHAQSQYFKVVGGIPHLPVLANTAAIVSPQSGMLIYSTAEAKPKFYSGSAWVNLCDANTISGTPNDYFKIVGGIPYIPAKSTTNGTTPSGSIYYSTSNNSLMVVSDGVTSRKVSEMGNGTFSVNSGFASHGGTNKIARFPILNTNPSPSGLSAGAVYINSVDKKIRYFDGTSWQGNTCSFVCGNPLTVTHTMGTVAPATKTLSYETGLININGTNKCWILRNLGADQQASSFEDYSDATIGWRWQFNRKQGYITNENNTPWDFNDNTHTPSVPWQNSINEATVWLRENDPCQLLLGSDWRLPANAEWNFAHGWQWVDDIPQAFQSNLKIASGFFWSSTQTSTTHAMTMASIDGYNTEQSKLFDLPIRCLISGNVPPEVIASTSTTNPVVGQTITVTYNYSDYESDLEGTTTFQWCRYSNETQIMTAISGATANTYTPQASDVGYHIHVKIAPAAITGNSPGPEIIAGGGYSVSSGTFTVTTTSASNVASTTATTGGSVSSGNATASQKGVCYGTSSNPTISTGTVLNSGAGNGSFTSNLTGLQSGTTYYVRAFITNSSGETSYGSQISFTTTTVLATLSTVSASSITLNGASSGGNISNAGGFITAKGICWSTANNPTIADSKTNNGTGVSNFSSSMTSLYGNTTYYVRAYATNSAGTAYGNVISFTTPNPCTMSTITDIDGNSYNTVGIGNQCWMTSNLKTTKLYDNTPLVNSTAYYPVNPKYCWYKNNISNKAIYGALYNIYAVYSFRLCPQGWHVPTDTEFDQLSAYLGGSSVAGGKMKVSGTSYWNSPNTGATNSSGFSAYPAGTYHGDFDPDGFIGLQTYTAFQLNSRKSDMEYGWGEFGAGTMLELVSSDASCSTYYGERASEFYTSVRCVYGDEHYTTVTTTPVTNVTATSVTLGGTVGGTASAGVDERGICWNQDGVELSIYFTYFNSRVIEGEGFGSFSATVTGLTTDQTYYFRAYAIDVDGNVFYGNVIEKTISSCPSTITDIEGNSYNTVQIGTQCWMAENLKTTKLNNNTSIGTSWEANAPAYCWYNYDIANKPIYGALYDSYAASAANLCPIGWHVPTDAEWNTLTSNLGGASVAGGKMKGTGTNYWSSPNTGATNSSGFTALPAGEQEPLTGYFGSLGIAANFWAKDLTTYRKLYSYSTTLSRLPTYESDAASLYNGFSVRCLKD